MTRLARQMINRPRRQEPRHSIETAGLASPKPHRRRGSERYAEDMLEHRPVSVPANSGTRVVWMSRSLRSIAKRNKIMSIGTILLIVLVLILVGALPAWPYSSGWGYYPSGIAGLIVLVLLIMLLMGRI